MKITLKNATGVSCLIVALIFIAALAISFFTTAGITWLIMYGLTAIGVALPIAWSWWLSAVIWLVLCLLGGIFSKG